jgi:hypothetical protein
MSPRTSRPQRVRSYNQNTKIMHANYLTVPAQQGSKEVRPLVPSSLQFRFRLPKSLSKLQSHPSKATSRIVLHALKDIDATYLVTDFRGPKGVDGEIEHGIIYLIVVRKPVLLIFPHRIASSSLDLPIDNFAGLKHLVFSSGCWHSGGDKCSQQTRDRILHPHILYSMLRELHLPWNRAVSPPLGL